MADIFGRQPLTIKSPVTADRSIITWDGDVLTSATNISIQYGQQINRRRSIGNKDSVIYAAQPQGQIQIGRLLADDFKKLFGTPSWNGCGKDGKLSFELKSGCGEDAGTQAGTFRCTGCVVTSYSVQAEAEGLTVIDQVTVDFMQLIAE